MEVIDNSELFFKVMYEISVFKVNLKFYLKVKVLVKDKFVILKMGVVLEEYVGGKVMMFFILVISKFRENVV